MVHRDKICEIGFPSFKTKRIVLEEISLIFSLVTLAMQV